MKKSKFEVITFRDCFSVDNRLSGLVLGTRQIEEIVKHFSSEYWWFRLLDYNTGTEELFWLDEEGYVHSARSSHFI